jgi:hypothetical protein
MRIYVFLFLTLIALCFFSSATADSKNKTDSPDGTLLVHLYADGGNYEVLGFTAIPGVAPAATADGDAAYSIYDRNGGLLKQGVIYLPSHLVHERAGEDGKFFGYLLPLKEPFTVTLPYYKTATELEFRRGGRLLVSRRIENLRSPAKKSLLNVDVTSAQNTKEELRHYLNELEHTQDMPPARTTAPALRQQPEPAKKIKATGTVTVGGVKDTSLIWAEIYFYRQGGPDSQRIMTTCRADGSFSIKLQEGKYLVRATCYYYDPLMAGQPVLLYPGRVYVSDYDPKSGPLNFNWKLYSLFRGRLTAKGIGPVQGQVYILERSLPNTLFHPYFVTILNTDTQGLFAVRLPVRKFAMIVLPYPSEPAAELLTIVKVKKSKKPKITTITCPAVGASSNVMIRTIWNSGPDNEKLNLVFLADAYTNGLESFTDQNGNGCWDGDLFLDENGNGTLDSGEYYYDRNYNNQYDAPEPFVDENGDGICNRYERARFEADAAVNAAALLNFEPFDEKSDRINVHTIWVASTHGVQRFTQAEPWKNMDTAFGSYCSSTGGFQPGGINTDTKAYARQYFSDAKEIVPVVLVHDPINVLRANAIPGFGRVLLSAEDGRAGGVLIHELGHSIGNLWDEYLYTGASGSPGYEPRGANATIQTDLSLVKWKEYIVGTPPVPTPSFYDGYGLFEGAGSYTTGVYRPSCYSMMRSTSYPFFAVNSKQLRRVLDQFDK